MITPEKSCIHKTEKSWDSAVLGFPHKGDGPVKKRSVKQKAIDRAKDSGIYRDGFNHGYAMGYEQARMDARKDGQNDNQLDKVDRQDY